MPNVNRNQNQKGNILCKPKRKLYTGEIPEGFDVIELEPCKLMVFQGEPYDDDDLRILITTSFESLYIQLSQ
jgi:hypothetical protein